MFDDGKPETRHLPTDERRMVDAALPLILEPGAGPLPDGLRDATADMVKGIRKTLNEVQVKHRKEVKRLADLEKYQAIPDLAEPEDTYEQQRNESLEMLEFCKAHEASLNRKLELLARAPGEFFLPIGSIVEFTDVKTAPNSLAILPDQNGEYPAAGSRGMVSALGHEREWGVAVTMRAPFKTAGGYAVEPSYERTITFRCDLEQLRVVGQALLPDGTPFSGYDWMPTHGRKPSYAGDKRAEEMILEADGYFWRLHDFGGTHSIEVLQAYEDIAEMSWLTGPLPQFMKEEPEEPSGPGM